MEVRHARMADAEAICEIINYHAERGRMLHRSLEEVYDRLRNFAVAVDGARVIGCVAVEIVWADLAELKSLAVRADETGRGIGVELVAAAVSDARALGLGRLFALTYVDGFFGRCGFRRIAKDELPSKVWSDCASCPKRDACDEIAVLMELA